jgi:hypothetical protein
VVSEREKRTNSGELAGTDTKDKQVLQDRRDAMRKIGRFSAYTAPALLALLTGEAYAQGDTFK